MKIKKKEKPYDFDKEYKGLPVIKKVDIIKIARNLLKQQKENTALIADVPKRQRKGSNL